MSVATLYENYNIDHWHAYFPKEQQYVLFELFLIYAAHKFDNVYYSFTNARSYLSDYECDCFGQLISRHDELHLKYIRSKFVFGK